MTDTTREIAFPLAYAHWYAASLFLDAGHPASQILDRLGIDAQTWKDCDNAYGQLHFANTGWVGSAYERRGLSAPEDDRDLYTHLTAAYDGGPSVVEPFSMRSQLTALRRHVEADPRIGPFADVDWIAQYLGERRFPTIRYVHNGTHVYVDGSPLRDRKGEPLAGIDPFTFQCLGDRWFRDARRVYGQGETPTTLFWFVARAADPDSFVVLNERYGADKAAGYYITNRRLVTEDLGTFEIVSYYYGRGQKPGIHVYESHYAKDSRKVYAYGMEIPGAHAPSFQAIGDEGMYFADRDRIYWERTPLEGADRASFTCASAKGQYRAYDKNRPYYAGKAGSVSGEFERWRDYFEERPELTDTWWHREQTRRAQSPDVATDLTPLGGPYFSDGQRVLVKPLRPRKGQGEWLSLDHFDLGSFQYLVDVFARDRDGLRYFLPGLEGYGYPAVKGADPDTFQTLRDAWFRDAKQGYYLDSQAAMPDISLVVVKGIDDSFEVLGGVYARDAKGLIVAGVRKKGIDDAGTVVALGHTYARQADTLLYRGKAIPKPGQVDPGSARGVHDRLLIDANGHMLLTSRYRKPLPDLDPATLRFLNHVFAVDEQRVYALTDNGLVRCDEVDRHRVETMGNYAIRVDDVRIHLSAGTLHRTPLDTPEPT